MELLPCPVLAKICSLTDDDTIYSLACSYRSICALMNAAKNDISFQRNIEKTYGLNVLREAIPEFSVVPYNVHNFENINVIKNYIGENISSPGYQYHFASEPNVKQFTTYYFGADIGRNDLLTSVKIKGDIYRLTFEFTLHTSCALLDKMTDGFWNILPTDEEGYKEVLSHFVPYVYFKMFPFSGLILKIQHIGSIVIQATAVNFDNHHKRILEDLTFRRNDTVFTHTIIPDMMCSNLAFDTTDKFILCQVYPSFISKGFAIIIKHNGRNVKNPCEIIKSIEIDLYDKSLPSILRKSYKFNSKLLCIDKVIRSDLYNLNFTLNDNCLYIPMNNVNFRYVSQTKFKIVFHNDVDIDNKGLIDIVYFSHNMIENKGEFGSRYYW
jgi:hypothetical protein